MRQGAVRFSLVLCPPTATWDAALGVPIRKVTVADLHFLAFHGLVQPLPSRGASRKPASSALLRLVEKLDRETEGQFWVRAEGSTSTPRPASHGR